MKISNQDLALFCQELAMIQQYGISLYEGFLLIMEEAKNKQTKEVLQDIGEQLEQGRSLHEALSSVSMFPEYMVEMIYIGELSGRLDEVLHSLAKYYQRAYDIQENIKSALRYPMIMIILMAIVIVMLFTMVLPIFEQVFQQLGQELTGFSKTMVMIGKLSSKYMFVCILSIIVIIFISLFFYRKKKQQLIATFPITKQLSLKMATSKFSKAIAVSLSSGLDIEESIITARKVVEHPILHSKIDQCITALNQEHDLSKALKESKIFTGVYGQLLHLSLRTGRLDACFQEIATRYDEEIDNKLIAIVNMIEPTLVIVLSIIVGIVLLSIMLPLIGIMANL